MASRKEQKDQARAERVAQKAAADSSARHQRLIKLTSFGVAAAAVIVVILVVLNQSNDKGGDASNVKGAAEVNASLEGIPQSGQVLGQRKAPVEIIEFGDLQCPACKYFADNELNTIIDDLVKPGDAKLNFEHLRIIGPQSTDAAKAALAAAEQGRYWQFLELFYRNQGAENAGYVTDDFLESIAKAAKVPDIAKWNKDRTSPKLDAVLAEDDRKAQQLGFQSTPSFQVEGPDGKTAVPSSNSAEAIKQAVEQVQ